jgi:outer membrane protein assembly factor BamB
VDGRSVYVSEDRGAIAAFERTTGRSFWRQDKLANRRLTAPLGVGTEVAFGDLEGQVHFLGRDTGAFVGRIATDGSAIRSAPIPLGNGFSCSRPAGICTNHSLIVARPRTAHRKVRFERSAIHG